MSKFDFAHIISLLSLKSYILVMQQIKHGNRATAEQVKKHLMNAIVVHDSD